MKKKSKNQVSQSEEGWDISVQTKVMQIAFPEYFRLEKPRYDWDVEENFIAYIQFKDFSEEHFRRFIIDYHTFAWETEVVAKYYDFGSPANTKNVLIGYYDEQRLEQDLENNNQEQDLENNNQEQDPYIDSEPIFTVNKLIWKEGIVFEKKMVQVEVTKIIKDLRIKIRVKGEKNKRMEILDEILIWFSSRTEKFEPIKIIECVCELCRRTNSNRYEIEYKYFINLQKKFVPQIQCYASGELLRLDDISPVSQPKIRLVIVFSEIDMKFFDEFYSFFRQKGEFDIELWDTRSKLLGENRPIESISSAINNAHIVIFMTSVYYDNEEHIRIGTSLAIQRFKNREIVAKVIQLQAFDWQDNPLFKKSGIQSLNQQPIEMEDNRAEAWRKVVKQTHLDIEEYAQFMRNQLEPKL